MVGNDKFEVKTRMQMLELVRAILRRGNSVEAQRVDLIRETVLLLLCCQPAFIFFCVTQKLCFAL